MYFVCDMHILYISLHYSHSLSPPTPHITHTQGDSERARQIAAEISAKMDQLQKELQFEITKKVTEDFKDPLGPLNALTQAAMAPLGESTHGSVELVTSAVESDLLYVLLCVCDVSYGTCTRKLFVNASLKVFN